jgi:hypothetical protein
LFKSISFFTGLLEKQNEALMNLEQENKILKDKINKIFRILAEPYIEEHYDTMGIILTLEDFLVLHKEHVKLGS